MSAQSLRTAAATAALVLLACAASPVAVAAKQRSAAPNARQESASMFSAERQTEHRGEHDDLLSAGLGLDGLRAMLPPAFADAAHPTAAELRRRALWANWRGIADLAPGGGYGELYGSLARVPGREFSAFANLPGAHQPHRVLVQVPDEFDAKKRCLVVSASSGSRGVYGSIAVAGAWGLPKGCAVAYTDKGAGTDYFDFDAGIGVRADGTTGPVAEGGLAFTPNANEREASKGVAFKHAHSRDNPEADWGRHVRQAAQFGLRSLDQAFPKQAPFTFANTRVIAVGISNGGGAVLRAAELDDEGGREGRWLDAVVAGEPNVYVEGARPLYDYTTEAALLMPCALLHKPLGAMPVAPISGDSAESFCNYAAALGLLGEAAKQASTQVRAQAAYERMRGNGWSDDALRAGALSVNFDLWRAVAATYASAYGRFSAAQQPRTRNPDQPWVRYVYSAGQVAPGAPISERAASEAERAAWWSDASGIPPGAGVYLFGPNAAQPEQRLAPLAGLRELWNGEPLAEQQPGRGAALAAAQQRVRKGIEATRASAPRKDLPIVVVHGLDDGLIPPAFSSAPYVAMAREAGAQVRYWQVRNVQHFDAFLGLPALSTRYLPLLPYVYEALDRVDAHLDRDQPLPADALIQTAPRAQGQALKAADLAIPR
ncbi:MULTISPECIES: 3-hydroxybutyrate oligomer hydrolase family protein [Lysobacter]|uniref:3-hydroxybutyrate oligomer hydrolase family protein n=1 Tax=Lysobacter TaxID=68 RepID=UPI0006901812|nr:MULTISPECIES: 3-hydroxybutyrate oligomer hydrolase family protein [Lysobacter]